jgi:uncharacterized protein (TIGR02996 family)
MTDGEALLNSILLNPEDLGLREVYADWLDEHAGAGVPCKRCHGGGTVGVTFLYSNPKKPTIPTARLPSGCTTCDGTGRVPNGFAERAEFIRVQVELARNPIVVAQDANKAGIWKLDAVTHVDALRRREAELLNNSPDEQEVPNWVLWLGGDNPSHLEYGAAAPVYRGGFIEAVKCDKGEFVGRVSELFLRHPIRQVGLINAVPSAELKLHFPWYWSDQSNPLNIPHVLDNIPRELFVLVAEQTVQPSSDPRLFFPTREAADGALERAALRLGRKTSGLV